MRADGEVALPPRFVLSMVVAPGRLACTVTLVHEPRGGAIFEAPVEIAIVDANGHEVTRRFELARRAHLLDDARRRELTSFDEATVRGDYESVSSTVQQFAGVAPTSVNDFLLANRAVLG